MKNIETHLAPQLPEAAHQIREEVFIREQGFENEFDEIDARSWHVLVFLNGKPAATGRLFESELAGVYTIGRVAVLKEYRGHGLGRVVMLALEQKAAQIGAHTAQLSAQCHAQAFYELCGYTAMGEIYLDEGCEHIHMEKPITPQPTTC